MQISGKMGGLMGEQSGWQLDGDAPEAYEKYIVPAFSGSWARDIVKRAALRKGEWVLDVACGTGIVARHAAPIVGREGRIAGVDINKVMLDKARQISSRSGLEIEWKVGDITGLPFPDGIFDAVLCQQGLQYFPNPESALKEMRRVLAPDGRVVISVWRPIGYSPFYSTLHQVLEKYVNADAAKTLASAYKLGDIDSLKSLVKGAGLTDIRTRLVIKQMRCPSLTEFFYGGMTASPFAEAIMALDDSVRTEMLQTIESSISHYIDDDGLAAPMESHVLTARK
jgi:ubiquinone/menaquinone biosynthesis C-methylase UbiE